MYANIDLPIFAENLSLKAIASFSQNSRYLLMTHHFNNYMKQTFLLSHSYFGFKVLHAVT